MPKLISVHFPKAAGSALRSAYEVAFGADLVLSDYSADPIDPCGLINLDPVRYEATKPRTLGRHRAVHGHFHIGRYDQIANAVRVVALREPVDNLLSIYYYWDDLRQTGYADGHCLFHYFCESRISLLEFAAIPAMRSLLGGVYFRNVDMKCFDIIGDYVDLDGYLRRVSAAIGVTLGPLMKVNTTPLSDERRSTPEDHKTLARLRDLLADDLRFYERYGNR